MGVGRKSTFSIFLQLSSGDIMWGADLFWGYSKGEI
jgi:hypothetical protein